MIFNYSGAASPIDPTRMAIGQHNYSYSQPYQQEQQFQPQALQQLGMQQQPYQQPYQQEPQAQQQPYQQEQSYQQEQPQALQQMGMQQQPLPQMPAMQPLLQQFRTQQRPYQSPYQSPFQQRSGQMFSNSEDGGRSGSAYAPLRQLNMLAPLNSNALNFSY
jgi:hypothetical protein